MEVCGSNPHWPTVYYPLCSAETRYSRGTGKTESIKERRVEVYLDTLGRLAETVSKIDHLSDEQRECIEDCNEASEAAEWCADECLGSEEMEQCARLCRDIADLTSLHARFMARDSNYSPVLAEACAGACEECATECERHDAEHCQVTAEVLRECAESCRNMMNA